jgi:hypothetical protein
MGLSYVEAKLIGVGHLHPQAIRGGRSSGQTAGSGDGMNRTEGRFSLVLEGMKRRGAILGWEFEPEKFRLADRTWLKVDFRVLLPRHQAIFVEVKARKKDGSILWTDDGAVKIKTVPELHPYAFFLASYGPDGWRIDRMPSRKWGCIGVDLTWDIQ